jgi:CHAT domain-containing protein
LSACETASGDSRASLGLAGIAIRSGARSTLGTLWQVNDNATSIFMAEFYQQLATSKVSKAEAIRNAQLALLQSREYKNPFFWAPFVLVGNWE